MRKLAFFVVLFSFILSTPARATVITVHDGDLFDFDVNNTYVFADSLTSADPQVTYGFDLGVEDHTFLRVTAPAGIDLVARITSGPDFSGLSISRPNSLSRVYAGTYFDFPLWGDWTGVGAGVPWWLTIAIIGEEGLAALVSDYGDELPVSDTFPDNAFVVPPDIGVGDGGDTGGGGGVSPVPEPASVYLMATGLLALGFTLRRKRLVL